MSYIAGISRGHNASVCLLKDGEIIFSIEEERLSRRKYDGGPYAAFMEILKYTNKVDYIVIAHTQVDTNSVEFSGDDIFSGLARKFGLVENPNQIIHTYDQHHMMHASIAFYRSGFKEAAAVVVDGAGTFIQGNVSDKQTTLWEVESCYKCSYPANFDEVYKHICTTEPTIALKNDVALIDDTAGIVKAYEAVSEYCGFSSIEAGKTMGLSPYGKPNDEIPDIISKGMKKWSITNRELVIPNYPNGAFINYDLYESLSQNSEKELSLNQNRRDLAYKVQQDTQQAVLDLIIQSAGKANTKNVVLSGGYGLNCVANYWYLDKLKPHGINLFVEPISNDAGTALGAALWKYYDSTKSTIVRKRDDNLYLGIDREIELPDDCNAINVEYKDIVKLLREKNIVAMFQGKSEAGPRALGNRSLLFDPTFEDGKDFVNKIKRREYFRPFAASVLESKANEWFDLKGLESSPNMMYAVDCLKEKQEIIPSVVHIDGTCRIQTVNSKQNKHYYNLIEEFYKETNIPLLFNTSFNLGGEPLVETLNDAINTLKKSDIEYLYLPTIKKLLNIKKEN